MATPTIPNGEEYFFPIIYEGNGGGQRVGRFVPFTDNGTIDNSCIFNSADSPVLSRTPSGTGTSKKTFTISAWIKRGRLINASSEHSMTIHGVNHGSGSRYGVFGLYNGGSGNPTQLRLLLGKYTTGSSTTTLDWYTNRTLEDTSKWYHLMAAVDTTDATAGDRVKLYIDGERVTSFASSSNPSLNDEFYFGSEYANYVSTYDGSFGDWDGYMAEVNFVDGTALTPDTFGVTDTSTGRWIPKTLSGITYGTNGFRLTFADSSALGDDLSGNTNDFTATNLASTNQTTDSPTSNFATLQGTGGTLSEGNLTLATGTSDNSHHNATLKPKSGKYYAEFTCNAMGRSEVGVVSTLNVPYSSNTTRLPTTSDGSVAGYMYYGFNGSVYYTSANASATTYATYTTNDLISIALDLDNHTVEFFKTTGGSGTRVSQGTISLPNGNYTFAMGDGATGFSGGWTANFGQRSFTHTPPTGFVALQQDNLPETAKGISGLVWMKNRDAADNHQWYDSSRGNTAVITSVGTPAETTVIDGLQKFLAGGQQIEDNDAINTAGESFVSWNWVGNGATEVTNTEGSVTTTVQANTTAGFSILKFTPPASGITDQTFGHGLTKAPEWFLFKRRDNVSTGRFLCFHKSAYDASNGGYSMEISSSNANTAFNTELGASAAYPAAPTATTISIKNNSVIAGGKDHIAYCWHSVEGFSKFGGFVGNGSANGPFIYTGFKPAWVMIKRTDATSQWFMFDNKRNAINPLDKNLRANQTNTESTTTAMDFLSNGFKIRHNASVISINESTGSFIYMAFSLHPFVGDGTNPVTAR